MIIESITAKENFILHIVTEDNQSGLFDVSPFLVGKAFEPLRDPENFSQVRNGKYYIEWACGADLSADTIEAKWIKV